MRYEADPTLPRYGTDLVPQTGLFFGVTLDALKHRDIAQVDGVPKRLVCFVTGIALAVCEAAKIHRMLKGTKLH